MVPVKTATDSSRFRVRAERDSAFLPVTRQSEEVIKTREHQLLVRKTTRSIAVR